VKAEGNLFGVVSYAQFSALGEHFQNAEFQHECQNYAQRNLLGRLLGSRFI